MAQVSPDPTPMLGEARAQGQTQGGQASKSNIIGSRNSAFQPYKAITILTNLQRGNVKTLNREVTSQPLTFHERAARGDLTPDDINGSNVNCADSSGKSALLWASFHARLPTVQLLLDRGGNPNFVGRRGETALMYAASNGHVAVLGALLSAGAEVEAVDADGNSALFYAAFGNHSQSIAALLGAGASLSHTNHNGDCAFGIAVSRGLHAAQHAMENYLRELIEAACPKVGPCLSSYAAAS